MAGKLFGAVKNFVGLSGDQKPQYTDESNTTLIGAGCSFFETDTLLTAVFDGQSWRYLSGNQVQVLTLSVLQEILEVLSDIRDEDRAVRLGVQTMLSAGDPVQDDLLDLSLEIRDQKNEE